MAQWTVSALSNDPHGHWYYHLTVLACLSQKTSCHLIWSQVCSGSSGPLVAGDPWTSTSTCYNFPSTPAFLPQSLFACFLVQTYQRDFSCNTWAQMLQRWLHVIGNQQILMEWLKDLYLPSPCTHIWRTPEQDYWAVSVNQGGQGTSLRAQWSSENLWLSSEFSEWWWRSSEWAHLPHNLERRWPFLGKREC